MENAKVTLRDVAKAAGVAESTVSRALAGNGQISDRTRNLVAEAAASLGYELPSRGQSDASRGRHGVIGVVVAALHNSFYPYLVDKLHDELDELGYDMVLVIDELTRNRAGRKIRTLIDLLDGVIVTTATIGSPMVEFLIERNMPTVLAIRSNQRHDVDVIESDNLNAGAEAMQHLVELGHRKFGFLLGPETTSTTVNRLKGARNVLDRNNIVFDKQSVIWGEFTHEAGYSGLLQLMRRPNPPTAVFCANDVVAIGALEACHKMGLAVPADVSLIGVDDIPMASWQMISLTTVRQPISEIGSLAARLIADRISVGNQKPPSHHILPTSIVRRATTGPARTLQLRSEP